MSLYNINKFSFKYPYEEGYALKDISLSVEKGEFILICGSSGSGKTTLLKQLKGSIASKGNSDGEILFKGRAVSRVPLREDAEKIGFVGQNPENTVVTDKVWKELSFTMESLGYDNRAIRRRTGEVASFFGLQDVFFENIRELSGGQMQMINIASAMILDPDVIILDEPCSRLDPLSSERLFNQLKKINRELGITVIISEHRTDELISFADRLIILDKGRIIYDGNPERVFEGNAFNEEILLFPQIMQIFYGAGGVGDAPVDTLIGKKWLSSQEIFQPEFPEYEPKSKEKAVSLKEVWFRYKKDSSDVLRGAVLDVYEGEIFSVLGGNGAGKTTLLSLIVGINKPYEGKVEIKDNLKVGYLPQNPSAVFSEDRIFDDLMFGENTLEDVLDVSEVCRIRDILHRNPYDVSGGERGRAALAKVLLTNPDILVLDEPTQGLDGIFKYDLGNLLRELQNIGKTIIIVSHDTDFCASFSDRCGLFFGGGIVSAENTRDFFEYNNFYTTQAKRISAGIIDRAVTVEDVLSAFGKNRNISIKNETQMDEDEVLKKINFSTKTKENKKKLKGLNICLILTFIFIINLSRINDFFIGRGYFLTLYEKIPFWSYFLGFGLVIGELFIWASKVAGSDIKRLSKKRLSNKTRLIIICLTLSIPITVFVGTFVLKNRAYIGVSAMVLAEVFLIFFMLFEKKRPGSEFTVIVSFMCAVAVAGRIVFFAVPQFKPLGAIIIIAAAAFGAGTGFFVGAVSVLASNMFFGQGPWTPWQMLAFGLMGFVAGGFFEKGLLKPNKLSMMILGGVLTVIIYGGIINPASIIMFNSMPESSMFLAAYALGLPFDVIHGASTMFFIWILGEPFLRKLNRLKEKYEIDVI